MLIPKCTLGMLFCNCCQYPLQDAVVMSNACQMLFRSAKGRKFLNHQICDRVIFMSFIAILILWVFRVHSNFLKLNNLFSFLHLNLAVNTQGLGQRLPGTTDITLLSCIIILRNQIKYSLISRPSGAIYFARRFLGSLRIQIYM